MPTQLKPKYLTYEEYQVKVNNLKTADDVMNFTRDLIAPALQTILEGEMTNHLGYGKHEVKGRGTGNSRNGHSTKTMRTSFGLAVLEIPRDRNGDFEPRVVPKYETVQSDIEEKIVSMYAKGMTTRDINAHMGEICGVDVSAAMVSSITDKILPLVHEWQERQLSPLYPILYLDGLHFKVRQDGRVVTKCAYIILGINESGMKDILGIWINEAEGSKFWMQVLDEIKTRGVQDILIACTDGLTGFAEAIHAIFPDTQIQQCIVHQVRNTLRFIPYKHKKILAKALRTIYTAPTEEAGLRALEEVRSQFPEYAIYLKSWETKWSLLSPFFSYPQEIRRIIYTTNAIEGLNRQFRKVTKTTSIFPHDEALTKLLFLATQDISKKWNMTAHNWGIIVSQLAILFPEKSHLLICD
ncbi:MAG: IS256 family transposase [bacterium]|nr:IS256 family transposase [bacterium]